MKKRLIVFLAIISAQPLWAQSAGIKTPITALQSACESEAIRTPASAYCSSFVTLVSDGNASAMSAAHIQISTLWENPRQLSTAYSTYKFDSFLTDTVANLEKAAASKAAANDMTVASKLQRQVGSPASSGGSTNLVSKPIATNLLAVAVESGALTENQNGNTITVQGNLDNILHEAVDFTPKLSYLPQGDPIIENFTVSASFTENGSSTATLPVTGSATGTPVKTSTVSQNLSATKFSSLTVNYLWNNRFTQKNVEALIAKHQYIAINLAPALYLALNNSANKIQNDFLDPDNLSGAPGCQNSDYDALATQIRAGLVSLENGKALTAREIPNTTFGQFKQTFNNCFGQASQKAEKKSGVNLDGDIAAYNQALSAHIASYAANIAKLPGLQISSQYTYSTPVSQPATHDIKLIFSDNVNPINTFTFNGDASFYASVPSQAKYGTLRAVQISGEYDRNLTSNPKSKPSAPSFSLAGYGQYQSNPSVLNITASSVPSGITLPPNSQVFLKGTQGWLGVVQAKFTFHLGGAAIPISGKWSNSTNLLDKSKLGAQFGISYDLSQLKQLLGNN